MSKTKRNRFPYLTFSKPMNYLLMALVAISWNEAKGQSSVNTTYDSYFIESQDTLSHYGPRSIVRNTLQDKNGHMWFATWQGIMHYDGKVFTNVTLKENLLHFRVFSVLEDKAGNLWFGTVGAGVYRYNGSSFKLFTTEDGLASNRVHSMLEDKAGNIWFGTDNGVSRYDGNYFTNFTDQFNPLLGKEVNSIVEDRTRKIWFGTRHGDDGNVICYDGRYFSNFSNMENVRFSNVRTIIEDRTGDIWIGGEDGLFRYDGESLTNVSEDFICDVLEDGMGNLWVSSGEIDPDVGADFTLSNTLYRFDGKTFEKMIEKREKENNQIFEIAADSAGNIWFGTGRGAFRYDGKTFTDFSTKDPK